ncbi:hypothetical protein BDV41DRAFT_543260 [Aspergillus transmontanensis]|uniref:Uncharacterized protein n=1 Tax=Aspergillus transmontanensis TaxID=1034304 RepID=A0A5N6VQU1_9EURO|nr:hypothetical protein BDV41DRAFT_543260 [Aspergillus transmontanensis]
METNSYYESNPPPVPSTYKFTNPNLADQGVPYPSQFASSEFPQSPSLSCQCYHHPCLDATITANLVSPPTKRRKANPPIIHSSLNALEPGVSPSTISPRALSCCVPAQTHNWLNGRSPGLAARYNSREDELSQYIVDMQPSGADIESSGSTGAQEWVSESSCEPPLLHAAHGHTDKNESPPVGSNYEPALRTGFGQYEINQSMAGYPVTTALHAESGSGEQDIVMLNPFSAAQGTYRGAVDHTLYQDTFYGQHIATPWRNNPESKLNNFMGSPQDAIQHFSRHEAVMFHNKPYQQRSPAIESTARPLSFATPFGQDALVSGHCMIRNNSLYPGPGQVLRTSSRYLFASY